MRRKEVIIIGAPRSGTNMLRDVICSVEGVDTWPCDEINYIWRHGNVRYPSDVFTSEMASRRVVSYIHKKFDWVADRFKAHTVVEKTCANSLRVPFVDSVLPEAKYIFIRRDGLDAVGSAIKRWKAELDISYLLRKARFVPFADLPYYGGRYLWSRIYRVISHEDRLAFWGPRLDGMDVLLSRHKLDEVCALQWQACVDNAADVFATMPKERWLEVGYENFVREPAEELSRILEFMELSVGSERRKQIVEGIRGDNIGKGRAALDHDAYLRLDNLVRSTLDRFSYS